MDNRIILHLFIGWMIVHFCLRTSGSESSSRLAGPALNALMRLEKKKNLLKDLCMIQNFCDNILMSTGIKLGFLIVLHSFIFLVFVFESQDPNFLNISGHHQTISLNVVIYLISFLRKLFYSLVASLA